MKNYNYQCNKCGNIGIEVKCLPIKKAPPTEASTELLSETSSNQTLEQTSEQNTTKEESN